jgi:DNA invertase Pin-like site-specific DNA recombinase
MAIVGYARVSAADQDLTIQIEQLTAAGCERMFSEKKSGSQLDGREEFEKCLQYLREGDTLMVTRIDRFARSMRDFFKTIELLEEKGVAFKVLHQPAIDTTTASGRLLRGILIAFAEFELEIRRERQREGIERAKLDGKYAKGRNGGHVSQVWAHCSRMLNEGRSYAEVSAKMNVTVRQLRNRFPEHAEGGVAELPISAMPTSPSAAETVVTETTGKGGARKPAFLKGLFART